MRRRNGSCELSPSLVKSAACVLWCRACARGMPRSHLPPLLAGGLVLFCHVDGRSARLQLAGDPSCRLDVLIPAGWSLGGQSSPAGSAPFSHHPAARGPAPLDASKEVMSRRPHWWFAYNDLSAEAVTGLGFRDRITNMQWS